MIISSIYAGLGNQMFQYATGYAKAQSRHEEFKIDISQSVFDEREYALSNYGISAEKLAIATNAEDSRFRRMLSKLQRRKIIGIHGKIVLEPEKAMYQYVPELFSGETTTTLYLQGYWQNYRYFNAYREELGREFTYRGEFSQKAKRILAQIESTNSIGIHIRRGDYLLYDGWTMDQSYYSMALEKIKKIQNIQEPRLFIFCEDAEFVKKLFPNESYTLVTDKEQITDIQEFELMRRCKHLIISNSSYSWWAAYLNENLQKTIVAPVFRQWSRNFYPNEWNCIQMNTTPLISMIVPVYNVEAYLEDCLNSICEQSYQKLEIILVDDGSTDHCLDICNSYKERDERVHVVHQKNQGLSAARNTGIQMATGEYLTFIDSDDYVSLDMIESLLQNIWEYQADISVGNYKKTNQNRKQENLVGQKEKMNFIEKKISELPEVYTKDEILQYLLSQGGIWLVSAWNKLYKADLFQEIRYPVGKLHEDEHVIHRLLFKCQKLVFDPKVTYFYRQRKDSIIALEEQLIQYDELEAYKERIQFLMQISYTGNMDKLIYKYIYVCQSYCLQASTEEDSHKRKAILDDSFAMYHKKLSWKYKIIVHLCYRFPKLYRRLHK